VTWSYKHLQVASRPVSSSRYMYPSLLRLKLDCPRKSLLPRPLQPQLQESLGLASPKLLPGPLLQPLHQVRLESSRWWKPSSSFSSSLALLLQPQPSPPQCPPSNITTQLWPRSQYLLAYTRPASALVRFTVRYCRPSRRLQLCFVSCKASFGFPLPGQAFLAFSQSS
jgi:hypothetical protein